MPTWTAFVAPVVGVLLGALITAVASSRRERAGRREQAQREALYALQDACLAHRLAYQALADAGDVPPDDTAFRDAGAQVLRTRQALELTEARILCDQVNERVEAWRGVVKPALLRDDIRNVTRSEEDAAWLRVQRVVKEELSRLS